MKISRYLDARAFLKEAKALKVLSGPLDMKTLERLERQRLLIPHLRLRYPDPIERRWWKEAQEGQSVSGELEPDGQRWEGACALETERQRPRWADDPTVTPHPLDDPEPRFLPFIERPAELPFVPWDDYRVALHPGNGVPRYVSDTVVTYYSSWQLLQFAEVANMGVMSFINLLQLQGFPSDAEIAAAPHVLSFRPVHAMHGFEKHAHALDAIVWFCEEVQRGYQFATRHAHNRRLISDEESAGIMRSRTWAAEQALARHRITSPRLLVAIRFLCQQWVHWTEEGRPLIADAYKTIAAQGIQLACMATGMTVDQYRAVVGHVGGYFKPIMDVTWPDWAAEQRQDARRILLSYGSPKAELQANFTEDVVDRFLAFIEAKQLHGFYWRLESFHRHSFQGNEYSLEGLKGDVQGMAVVLEHITAALGAKKEQLREKFKELWARDAAVLKLLKNNAVMKVGNGASIDLNWFEERNALSLPEQTAADLAISYAIRGGAHRVIAETNPLKLERMMLIMLRAAVKTFEAATKTTALAS